MAFPRLWEGMGSSQGLLLPARLGSAPGSWDYNSSPSLSKVRDGRHTFSARGPKTQSGEDTTSSAPRSHCPTPQGGVRGGIAWTEEGLGPHVYRARSWVQILERLRPDTGTCVSLARFLLLLCLRTSGPGIRMGIICTKMTTLTGF